jgi:hypothetical protein
MRHVTLADSTMIRGPHCSASPGAQKSPAIEVALGNGSCAVASVTRGPVSHQDSVSKNDGQRNGQLPLGRSDHEKVQQLERLEYRLPAKSTRR